MKKKQPPELFYKKAVFKDFAVFSGKHLCWNLFLIKLQGKTLKRLTQVVSSEICEIFKNTYIEKQLRMAILSETCGMSKSRYVICVVTANSI